MLETFMGNKQDIWRKIPSWEGIYDVSRDGRVRSVDRTISLVVKGSTVNRRKRGRVLRPGVLKTGYHQVSLTDGDRRERHSIHCLVAYAFLGPRPAGLVVCHNDGDKSNNSVLNLRYDTHRANSNDRYIHGTILSGSGHPMAKLTNKEVEAIKLLGDLGKSPQQVWLMFQNVTRSNISMIMRGKSWTR